MISVSGNGCIALYAFLLLGDLSFHINEIKDLSLFIQVEFKHVKRSANVFPDFLVKLGVDRSSICCFLFVIEFFGLVYCFYSFVAFFEGLFCSPLLMKSFITNQKKQMGGTCHRSFVLNCLVQVHDSASTYFSGK